MVSTDGTLGSIWSQLFYAKRALSPVGVVLKVILFLLLHCTGVFLYFGEYKLNRQDKGLVSGYRVFCH